MESASNGDLLAISKMQRNRVWRALQTAAVLGALIACSAGTHHTRDSVLEKNFLQHEADFRKLLVALKSDPELEMVAQDGLRYSGRTMRGSTAEVGATGHERDKWQYYRKVLQDIGVFQAINGQHGVFLKVDEESIANGSSAKGYWYAETAPSHQLSSLDEYRVAKADRGRFGDYVVAKPLKGNWYLFLLVNGR